MEDLKENLTKNHSKYTLIFKKNKNFKEDKIISLKQDIEKKLIIIYLTKSNNELDFEKLGCKVFDFLKNNEINEIYYYTLQK